MYIPFVQPNIAPHMFHSVVIRDGLSVAAASSEQMLLAPLTTTRPLVCIDAYKVVKDGAAQVLLDSIIEFCNHLREIVENTDPATDIVICSGCSNAEAASFVLVGCYLILHEGRQLETVKALFHNQMPGPALAVAQSTGDASIGFAGSADSSDVWDALDHAVDDAQTVPGQEVVRERVAGEALGHREDEQDETDHERRVPAV